MRGRTARMIDWETWGSELLLPFSLLLRWAEKSPYTHIRLNMYCKCKNSGRAPAKSATRIKPNEESFAGNESMDKYVVSALLCR